MAPYLFQKTNVLQNNNIQFLGGWIWVFFTTY